MKKIRFAVLGTGPRGQSIETVYTAHPDVEFVAVCDIADGYADEAAKRLSEITGNKPKAFTSYEEMSKNAAYDAVCITCDPDIQVDYAVAEMDRGIHVMTEVPAARIASSCFSSQKAA